MVSPLVKINLLVHRNLIVVSAIADKHDVSYVVALHVLYQLLDIHIRGCIQNCPDWPPGARAANGTALCH